MVRRKLILLLSSEFKIYENGWFSTLPIRNIQKKRKAPQSINFLCYLAYEVRADVFYSDKEISVSKSSNSQNITTLKSFISINFS